MSLGIISATALIDWNSQIHAAKAPSELAPVELARFTLQYVCRTIGRVLFNIDSNFRFDVILRLYHGWYRGFEPTTNRKAIIEVFSEIDLIHLSEKSNVIIRRDLYFGDNLLSASTHRLHTRLGCHLPNTLRRNDRQEDEFAEKMVDTAIASDLVDLAHSDRKRWLLLFADDDDLVPPALVAEGLRSKSDGKVLLIRGRNDTPFLKLENLRVRPC